MTLDCKFPNDVQVLNDVTLSDYTTFRLGGPVAHLITCKSPTQLEKVVEELSAQNIDFVAIGSGSNILASDSGVDKVVVRYVSDAPLIERKENDIIVSGSTLLDDVVRFAAVQLLKGLNFATGIYGTVGGAICGNAGALGRQIGDILTSVTLIDKFGYKREAEPASLGFRYRSSKLKETGEIVMSARFSLQPGDRAEIEKERSEILLSRAKKLPDPNALPCAGSFFRNFESASPEVKNQSAGQFLERAGAKKMSVGGAKVFEKHANIIVKYDDCSAQDVFDLSKKMQAAVKEKFGTLLVREVRLLGVFEGMPKDIKGDFW